MDVLGYLGASFWRSGCILVGSLVFSCVLVCVFLQRYFGMYLLRGISTLYAPALPRTRLYAYLRAYVRLCAFPLARLGSSLGFLCASGACLFSLLHDTMLASFAHLLRALGCALVSAGYASAWLSLAFLLRKALALSFMHTSAFCIIYILSNACVPKTCLYKSYV